MARKYADRVLEISTTTGTGNIALNGPPAGYQSFQSNCAVGDTFDYSVWHVDANGVPTGEWETGRGTFATGNTIARAVQESSNANALVNFTAGNKVIVLSENAASIAALSGGGGGSYSQIGQTIIVGAAQSHITFLAIPQTFTDLILVGSIVGQAGATGDGIVCQLSGDSAAHYSTQNFNHYGTDNNYGQSYLHVGKTGAYIGAGISTCDFEGTFVNYKRTSGAQRYVGAATVSDPGNLFSEFYAGQQNGGPGAITSIDLFFSGATQFDVGTIVSLYGRN